METDNIMKYDPVLPEDFDGVFRFSNPSNEDFVGVWGGVQYLFPAKSTTPMVMVAHSPLEIQYIRKKFARDLAEREFYKSKDYKSLAAQEGTPGNRVFSGIHQAATYTEKDLVPYIQACLKPLPAATMTSKPVEKVPLEEILHKNDEGEPSTVAIDKKTSLRKKALES